MKNYTHCSRRATRNATPAPIVCAGCGHAGSWGCFCHVSVEVSARYLLRAFMDAGNNLTKRRAALSAMNEWQRIDDIKRREATEERGLIAGSKADKVRRMRGLTEGRLGGRLALHLHRRMFEPQFFRGAPVSIEVLARRHRVPLAMVKGLRDRFIRRTAFAAMAASAPVGPDTRRLLQLGNTLAVGS